MCIKEKVIIHSVKEIKMTDILVQVVIIMIFIIFMLDTKPISFNKWRSV